MAFNQNNALSEFESFEDSASWDWWSDFEMRHFFALFEPQPTAVEEYERQSRRKPVCLNGILWKPVSSAAVANKDMEFLYGKLRQKVFARLEPESAAENAAHPERYNSYCIYCEIRTGMGAFTTCPVCEHELLDLPLNDMDD
jgi:hypothetical protein